MRLPTQTLSRCVRRFLSTLLSLLQLFRLVFHSSFVFLTFVCFTREVVGQDGRTRRSGPSSASVASCALVFPPSLTSIVAFGPPISVFTQPGCAEFTLIWVSRSSWAR